MKKLIYMVFCAVLCLSLLSCSRWSVAHENAGETVTDTEVREGFDGVTAPPVEDITDAATEDNSDEEKKNAALDAVRAKIGEKDAETGLKYIFSYDGTEISDGKEYIKIRVSLRTEDGVNSLFGYYLVDENGNVK